MFCAVIVDSRPISDDVIDRHMRFLPGWDLHVFTQAPSGLIDKHGCECSLCPPIRTSMEYNRFLTLAQFWEKLTRYERVLIFQHDSGILREGIDEFLEWDFIGAPIKHIAFPRMNGGFSLRNPRKMLEIVRKHPYPSRHNEDVYFCEWLMKYGKLPDKETAQKFSVETIFGLGSFGWHQIDAHLSPEECNEIRNQYDIVSV